MAASVSTQHTLQDLRDHDLTIFQTVSLCDKPGAIDLFPPAQMEIPTYQYVLYIKSKCGRVAEIEAAT